MLLRVASKGGIWGFGPLWLTFADMGPTEVDYESLDEKTRRAIDIALASDVLMETDENGDPLRKESPSASVSVAPISMKNVGANKQSDLFTQEKARQLLDGNVHSVRREVSLIGNIQVLNAAIDLEQKTKNRKTVLGYLRQQLQKILGNTNGNRNLESAYRNLIKDEEEEEIVISVSDLVVQRTYEKEEKKEE